MANFSLPRLKTCSLFPSVDFEFPQDKLNTFFFALRVEIWNMTFDGQTTLTLMTRGERAEGMQLRQRKDFQKAIKQAGDTVLVILRGRTFKSICVSFRGGTQCDAAGAQTHLQGLARAGIKEREERICREGRSKLAGGGKERQEKEKKKKKGKIIMGATRVRKHSAEDRSSIKVQQMATEKRKQKENLGRDFLNI